MPTLGAKGKTGTTGRVDSASPPKPPGTAAAKANGNGGSSSEWRPADDLDVLEEELLPLRSRS
jgi:hypothetical protein